LYLQLVNTTRRIKTPIFGYLAFLNVPCYK